MRKDMAKVIVERPRRGSVKWRRKGRARPLEDEDDAPLRVRASAARPEKTKSLNENLAPLRRYLEGQVGRPWNKVYSEISEHLKPANTVQQHVRDHIEDFVAIKTRMEGGKVVIAQRSRGGDLTLADCYQKLYVHPQTGLLRRNSHWRSWKAKADDRTKAKSAEVSRRLRDIAPDRQLHLLNDGGWWEIQLAKVKTLKLMVPDRRGRLVRRDIDERYFDVLINSSLTDMSSAELYGRQGVYATAKRPLNKREMKAFGLR
jgi:hypothetical protein